MMMIRGTIKVQKQSWVKWINTKESACILISSKIIDSLRLSTFKELNKWTYICVPTSLTSWWITSSTVSCGCSSAATLSVWWPDNGIRWELVCKSAYANKWRVSVDNPLDMLINKSVRGFWMRYQSQVCVKKTKTSIFFSWSCSQHENIIRNSKT